MEITLNISGILIIAIDSLGIILSLTTGVLLFFQKGKSHISQKLLAILLILSSLTLLNDMLVSTGINNRFKWLYYAPIYYTLSVGPLFYLYIRSKYSNKNSGWYRQVKHLIMPAVQAFVYLFVGFRSIEYKTFLWEQTNFPLYLQIESVLFPVSLLFYSFLSRHLLKSKINENYFWSKDLTKWLGQFSLGVLIVACIEMGYLLLDLLMPYFDTNRQIILISHSFIFSAFIFWIALNGFKQYYPSLIYRTVPDKSPDQKDDEEAAILAEKINYLMKEEKIFLNPDLNLKMLAGYIGKTERITSRVINNKLSVNFNGFVNKYRVDEFISKIERNEHHFFTITALAYDCGFDSKSTFNRVFKQIKGIAPSEFIKDISK